MHQKIAIIDYGTGNLHSVYKRLVQLNQSPFIVQEPGDIAGADKIILPGVGHFRRALEVLKRSGLENALQEAVLVKNKPVLGICLGMQLMAEASEEAPGAKGLGWFRTNVVRFQVSDKQKYKVPHIGWNTVDVKGYIELLAGVEMDEEFYFCHSYHFAPTEPPIVAAETSYDYSFLSAVAKKNIFGVQFHPEKSHDQGLRLFKNFLAH